MYNELFKQELDKYDVKDIITLQLALREIGQKIILSGLSNSGAFDHISFYGGTCLRIFHGLKRYSEDLDFALLDGSSFSLAETEPYIKQAFNDLGIKCEITSKDGYDSGFVMRRYVKFLFMDTIRDYYSNSKIVVNPDANISIKVEVDKGEYGDYRNEYLDLDFPKHVKIRSFDMSSLFASKIPAILFRNWKTRVKGRDFYDYLFYINNSTPINIDFLRFKLNNYNLDLNKIKEMLLDRFNAVNYKLAKEDILPFVSNVKDIENWKKETFIETLKLVKTVHLEYNQETKSAIEESQKGEGLSKGFKTSKELSDDLDKRQND